MSIYIIYTSICQKTLDIGVHRHVATYIAILCLQGLFDPSTPCMRNIDDGGEEKEIMAVVINVNASQPPERQRRRSCPFRVRIRVLVVTSLESPSLPVLTSIQIFSLDVSGLNKLLSPHF